MSLDNGNSTGGDNITDMFTGPETLASVEPAKEAPPKEAPPPEPSAPPAQEPAFKEEPPLAEPELSAAPQTEQLPTWFQQYMQQQQQQQQQQMRQYQQTHEMNQRHVQFQAELLQQAQARQMAVQQAEQDKARQAQRVAMAPRAPDPRTSTVEDIIQWQREYAEYQSKMGAEDAEMKVSSRIQALENSLKEHQTKFEQRAMEEQNRTYAQQLEQTISAYAGDPRFPFMKDPVVQNGFTSHWWAVNEYLKNNGQPILDPAAAMQSFIQVNHAFNRSQASGGARVAAQSSDQAKRTEQQRRGVSPTLGTSNASAPNARGETERKNNIYNHMFNTNWSDSTGQFKS